MSSESPSSTETSASEELVIPVRSKPAPEASTSKSKKKKKRKLAQAKPLTAAAGPVAAKPASPRDATPESPVAAKPAAPRGDARDIAPTDSPATTSSAAGAKSAEPRQPKPAEPRAAKPAGPKSATPATATPATAKAAQPKAGPALAQARPLPARPIPVSPADSQDEVDEEAGDDVGQFILSKAVPGWLVSMVVHAIILLTLAMMLVKFEKERKDEIVSSNLVEPVTVDNFEPKEPEELNVKMDDVQFETPQVAVENIEPQVPEFATIEDPTESPLPAEVKVQSFSDSVAPVGNIADTVTQVSGQGGFAGRKGQNRTAMALRNGATRESEAAVAMALEWLAKHQNRDGSWSFDHGVGPCQRRCANPGSLATSRMGSTGMALLPFLGAGQTHKQGKYKKNVEAGLYFLTRNMKVKNAMGDMMDSGGRMYSHGLASIALCEAYGMTKDRALRAPAQLAVNFICYAQDPVGGGWRYRPQQKGDTSVVGWQLMALKSAHLAYLKVPPQVVKKASLFLDSVQVNYGSQYGYASPGARHSTSSIGLLCRMYLGWKRENPSLRQGVEILSKVGPTQDMYYNYYATQVMRHFDGPQWKKWNTKMRDWLVQQQSKDGHARGSWFVGSDHGTRSGGRLYATCLSTMILEVYYRHMPIYGKQAAEDDFPF